MNLTAASAAQTRTIDDPGRRHHARAVQWFLTTLRPSTCAFDNITCQGVTRPALAAVALPANSTAQVSCQNNPNGTECHSVTDVRTLHAGTAAKCTACHNATFAPTVANCQNTGCHVGVNIDEHTATGFGTPVHHENGGNFASFAASGECAGCHDNSVAKEHSVLTANAAKPCSVCHATNYTVGTYSPAKATVDGADHCEERHVHRLPHDVDADRAARPASGHERHARQRPVRQHMVRAQKLLDHGGLANEHSQTCRARLAHGRCRPRRAG